MDQSKVAAVRSWPQPRSARGLRGFLGLAGYYRRFIQDYGIIAAPLTQLLRKDGFQWSSEAKAAFMALKAALSAAPVLHLPDFGASFIVDSDASGPSFGAVLHQDGAPLAFFSRPFAARHLKVAAYERELIGLIQAVRHWRPYLWGRAFVVQTDHYALKYMLDQRLSTIPQHHWISKLFGYDFRVEFRSGKTNMVADALSHRDGDAPLLAALVATEALFTSTLSAPSFRLFDDLRRELVGDPALRAHLDAVAASAHGPDWTVRDGLILHRVFVPSGSALLENVLQLAHIGGHEGIQKTLHRLRAEFFVEHDRRVVGEFVRSCATCQRNKMETLHPAGLLQPLPIPSRIWADVSLDFIEALPKVHGKSVLLTVVDRFSKYAHFIPLGHPYTASSVARAFFQDIVRLHGIPESIVSDRDPVFTGHVWRDLFRRAGVKLLMSSAFHPQTDGQSEAVNKTITMYLRCLTGDRPRSGSIGFLGPSSATTRRTRHRCKPPRSRSSTAEPRRTCCHTSQGRRALTPSTPCCPTGMSSSKKYVLAFSKLKNTLAGSTTPTTVNLSSPSGTGCCSECCIDTPRAWCPEGAANWRQNTPSPSRCWSASATSCTASSCQMRRASTTSSTSAF